jgi:hypothetical protein
VTNFNVVMVINLNHQLFTDVTKSKFQNEYMEDICRLDIYSYMVLFHIITYTFD